MPSFLPVNPKLGIALAGGGSWGAYTSGALQALIEAGIITTDNIGAISGTSAGAANAAILSHAANSGDVKKAVPVFNSFWRKVVERGEQSGFMMTPAMMGEKFPNLNSRILAHGKETIRLLQAWGMVSQPGTLAMKIESALGRDWSAIQTGKIKTYIGTVQVSRARNGEQVLTHKTFENRDITPNVIASSGTIVGRTRVGNDYYVDGAYLKNPAMDVLEDGGVTDIIAIVLYPQPKEAIRPEHENDITISQGKFVGPEVYRNLAWLPQNSKARIHVIDMAHEPHWNETSKMNISREWVTRLYNEGYERTKEWIAKNGHNIGKASTFKPAILGSAPAAAVAAPATEYEVA